MYFSIYFFLNIEVPTITEWTSIAFRLSWPRHYGTSRKVEGSIPVSVTEIFDWHYPSGRSMALGSTQNLTERSNSKISWGIKAADAWGWQPYHLRVTTVLKSGSLNLLEQSGPVQRLLYLLLLVSTVQYSAHDFINLLLMSTCSNVILCSTAM